MKALHIDIGQKEDQYRVVEEDTRAMEEQFGWNRTKKIDNSKEMVPMSIL